MPTRVNYSLLKVDEKEASQRLYRITIPLVNFHSSDGGEFAGRTNLGCNAILANLNQGERDRLQENNSSLNRWEVANHRLEVHDVRPGDVHDQLRLLLQSVLLVAREPIPVLDVVLDRKVDGVWRRAGDIRHPYGRSRYTYRFPADRIGTLRELREGMGLNPPKQVRRALDHYENSVYSLWRGEPDNALVLAALSFESLLGNNLFSEISYRLCLRAASLVETRPQFIFERLKKLYALRSGVVHGGKTATPTEATHMQQALMRLIPAVAALSTECGSYDTAMDLLDRRAYDSSIPAPRTISSGGWWSFVPLAECFDRELGPLERGFYQGAVWLFDY